MAELSANRTAHLSLRVLFVDDEKPLQEFMRTELPRLGHEVTVCADGRAAMKALEKGTFDAAILDLRMPGMNGIEVLEHLKNVALQTRVQAAEGPTILVGKSAAMAEVHDKIAKVAPHDVPVLILGETGT